MSRLPGSTVHVVRFAAIAVLTTAVYVLLYLSLRAGLSAQASNALALVATAAANAGANRRWTFDVRGRVQAGWYRAEAVFTFGVALVLTSSYLSAAHAAAAAPTRLVEVTALVLAISVATLLQFVLLMRSVLSSSTVGSPMVAGDRN
jgi:putative flippase GtrA